MSRKRWIIGGLIVWSLAIVGDSAEGQAPSVSRRPADGQVVFVSKNEMIPVRDGVKLAADIYRPAKNGAAVEARLPTLLTRTPYGKGNGDSEEAKYYAARGYVVVMNDVRGRYASEGTWRMLADDPNDGYDVVEWIAAQSWSDGKVGTFGTSYPGGTQHALAEMNPPHLSTMIPVDSVSNLRGRGHAARRRVRTEVYELDRQHRRTVEQAGARRSQAQAALEESGRRIVDHVDNLPIRRGTTPLKVVPEYEDWLVEAMRSGPESPFWKIKGMSVVDHLGDYKDVPVLHITGWYDSWTRQVAMNYEALSKTKKSPQRLIIGPWVHGGQRSNVAGEVEFGADAALDFNALRLAWYDRWMKNADQDDAKTDSPVLIYVMGTGDDRKSTAGRLRHGGFWRARERMAARADETDALLSPRRYESHSATADRGRKPNHV